MRNIFLSSLGILSVAFFWVAPVWAAVVPITPVEVIFGPQQVGGNSGDNISVTLPVSVPPNTALRGWQPWLGLSVGSITESGLRLHSGPIVTSKSPQGNAVRLL